MQTQPIRATAPKARTRKEIFAVETSTGAADKYFRIGADVYIDGEPLLPKLNQQYLTEGK